jgi:hypothetical protein
MKSFALALVGSAFVAEALMHKRGSTVH